MKRLTRAVLAIETAITVPIFLAAFWICSAIGAVRAGRDAAALKDQEKRALLERLFDSKGEGISK